MIGLNPVLSSHAPSAASKRPAAHSTSSPKDSVELGADGPSRLYRIGRGLAGLVGGLGCGLVGAGVGGVQHAGDQSIKVPRPVVSTAAIAGAGLGLFHGIAGGLAGGPIGVALGIVVGPTVGAFLGGGAVLGAACAVDAVKGSISGAREGFKAGYRWTTDVVDRMAGHKPEPPSTPPSEPPAAAGSVDPTPSPAAGDAKPSADEKTMTPAEARAYMQEMFD
jgi:hypothetical protein